MADIRKALKKFVPHFLMAREENRNESDTVALLCRAFEQVFGYDGMTEISHEARLKNKYIDVTLKIDGVVKLLVEAKAAAVELRDRHIEQAQGYAAHNNYRWVLLTNGVAWNLYHLTFEEGIDYEQAFSVDLSKDEAFDDAAACLAHLQRDAIRKGELEEFWQQRSALSAGSIGKALFAEGVLRLLRRQIRKDTGLLIDTEDLATALHEMLSTEAREQIGPMKIRRRRRAKRQGDAEKTTSAKATLDTPAGPVPIPAKTPA